MNPFRHLLLRAGHQQPLGTWLMSGSPIVAEALGHAGFDWGVIDMEHAPLDLKDVVHLLQAVAGTRMVPVLRVPWNDAVVIKRVLDAGAQTLLVPFVQDADEARRAVAATRYPPAGVRGMAGMTRATRYGTITDYTQQADKGLAVIVQLESPQALDNLEAIAQVPGVDALFLGPADLSATMGLPGRSTHPSVTQALTDAVRRARTLAKPVGIIGDTPEMVAQYRAAGFDFVAITCDIGLMMRAARSAIDALHGRPTEQVHDLAAGTQDVPNR